MVVPGQEKPSVVVDAKTEPEVLPVSVPKKKKGRGSNKNKKKRVVQTPSEERKQAKNVPAPDPLKFKQNGYQGTSVLASNEVMVTISDFVDYLTEVPTTPPAVNSVRIYYFDTEQQLLNTDASEGSTNNYKPGVRILSVELFALPLVTIGTTVADSLYLVKTMVPSSQNESNSLIIGFNSEVKAVLPDYDIRWVKVAHYKTNTLYKSGVFRPFIKNASDQALFQIAVVNPDDDQPFTGRTFQFKIVIKAAAVISPSQNIKIAFKGEDDFGSAGAVTTTLNRAYIQIDGLSKNF